MAGNWNGSKLKTLRKRFGEPQSVFCRRLGVTLNALSKWEQGGRSLGGAESKLLDRIEEDLDRITPGSITIQK